VAITQPPLATVGPGPTVQVTSAPPSTPATNGSPAKPTPFTRPVTWADRHLQGKLIFTAGTEGILQLDLATGTVTNLFAPADPVNSWVVASAVSPADQHLVMAYAPPPSNNSVQFGYTSLYALPAGGAGSPQPVFGRPITQETYFDPAWSPDGKWLYYVHLTSPITQTGISRFAIERMAYPDGQPALVAQDAFWPRLSADGTHLALVHYDYTTGIQTLFVAAPDGTQARQVALPADFQSTDSPMFTPDGKAIIFSGITNSSPASLSWFDRLLGVHVAYADGSPADWYRVSLSGGPPVQLNRVADTSMYGTFAPDGQHIAYISSSGVFVMKPDGTDIVPMIGTGDLTGSVGAATVDWLH
jgi:hypothetical protein